MSRTSDEAIMIDAMRETAYSNTGDSPSGIILFGHGARDPRWAEPFDRLATRVRAAHQTKGPVSLAFLELMTPDLPTAIAVQVNAGCRRITVIPVFFGQGAHLRRDFPALMDQCRALHPTLTLRQAGAVGEDEMVLDAIGEYVLRVAD